MIFRLALLALLALLAPLALTSAAQPPAFDILIRGGRVLDGTGNPWYRADIGISGDRIRAMGNLAGATAKTVIDAKDRFVTPGFIDVHSHAGGGLATDGLKHGQPLLAQGLTTVFVNPDGGGPVDLAAQRATYTRQRIGTNVGLFVPHGSIRRAVMEMSDRDPECGRAGEDGRAHASRAWKPAASDCRAGCTTRPAAIRRPPKSSRWPRPRPRTAASTRATSATNPITPSASWPRCRRSSTIAEQGGVTGVVSHMKALGPASWGLSKTLIGNIEAARTRGVQVFADQYPYEASGTGIVGALMPRSAQVGGRDAMMKRILGELRPEIRAAVKDNIARRGGADTLVISRYSANPSFEGQRLSDLAAKAGVPPEEYALQMLEKGDASLVSFNMSEGDIEGIMRQPWTMTCTDGDLVPMGQGKPHPRAYGAFARKLKRYVRERGTVDIASAVRSMTTLPATVFGLKDRGQLRAGAFADILIFDLSKVNDAATYTEPHQLSEGIDDILVNGELVRREGKFTSALAGRVLTPERR